MPWLINSAQLEKFRKNQKNVVILDASWYLPVQERNAHDEFTQSHIVSAQFFNLDDFHDSHSSLPYMLIRDEESIREKISQLGISNETKIMFYDHGELHTACRALWMFKVFGHASNQLYILDGGFKDWMQFGGKIESGPSRAVSKKKYEVKFQAQLVRTLLQMKSNLKGPKEQVVDVRHPVRYAGGKEPRHHLRAGHIPGSFCFPYFTMLESNGKFKSLDQIQKQLLSIGVELSYPIISTCGSGITSAILSFVLDLLGHHKHALYDGSWAEWGADTLFEGEPDLFERPVVTSIST